MCWGSRSPFTNLEFTQLVWVSPTLFIVDLWWFFAVLQAFLPVEDVL
ncbi:Unannotated [Lentimonas sp. CC19]|nr:Unannotated [Lentimonas sp. CC19]CAA6694404.1 Unannotated [Lentimonas sp. CC10]CAA7070330.1 Unannotated [Lentimonas sp. CC11]CAA7075339.1 Unannotated [Lentimonas sp. CC4]